MFCSFRLTPLLGLSQAIVLGDSPLSLAFEAGTFLILAGCLGLLGYTLWARPLIFVRTFLWILRRTLYRIRVVGQENIPATGPALLVCNHVSYIDWLLLLAAQPRYIRFLVYAPYANIWGIRHLLRWARVIPIDGAAGTRAVLQALRTASAALAEGNLVCIFAEGSISRTGFLLPFHRGFEQILRRTPAPIIPVCLDQVWGSIFSYSKNRFFWKWPREIPFPVGVSFGKPLPATTSAADTRLAVQRLSAEWVVRESTRYLPAHRQFVRNAARHPFKPCVFDPFRPEGLTYGRTLAGALILRKRLQPLLGDVPMTAVWLPTGVGGVLTNIVLALMGKTSVNLNYTAGPEAIASALKQCGIRHVVTSRRFTARMNLEVPAEVSLIYLEDLASTVTKPEQVLTFLRVLVCPGWWLERRLGLTRHGLDDLATIIFSSGSTGEPKGVMLTHRNVASNALACIQHLNIHPNDRILGILPLFHSFGYTVTFWTPLQIGASSVYFADPRAAKEIGELCKKYRPNIFLTTPTFLRFCLRRCGPEDFRSLTTLVCGAEKLPQSLAQEFHDKFGVLPLEGYGCTELSPVVSTNTPDVVLDGVVHERNRPGSIGQPVPGVTVKVVSADDPTQTLPVGQEGLLYCYGPNVMKGYLHKEELTRSVIREGWYCTGDMARIDEDGFIFLTGRLSRFAKVAGEMVPLEKVEEELQDLLETGERMLAVTCVPDESRGERLIVLYTNLQGREPRALGKGLAAKGIPNLWVPAERDFYQVPELPILGSGKLDLKKLQESARELVSSGRSGPHGVREAGAQPSAASS